MSTDPDPLVFGARVRRGRELYEARTGETLTQAELARRVGASKNLPGNWENGRNMPGRAKRAVVARELGVSLEWLEGRSDDPGDGSVPELPPQALAEHSHYMSELGILAARYATERAAGGSDTRLRRLEREMIAVVENGLRREGRAETSVRPLAETIVRRIKRASDPPAHDVADAAM